MLNIEGFAIYLLHFKGLSQESLRVVEGELHRWNTWLFENRLNHNTVTSINVQQWLAVAVEKWSSKTIDKKIWVLRSFYTWAEQQNFISSSPWRLIVNPKRIKWMPRFTPSESQVSLLLSQPDIKFALGIRDRAILELIYATGIRASELVNLKFHHVSLKQRSIIVMGKGRRERMVIFGEQALFWLNRYFEIRRQLIANYDSIPSELFISTKSGNGLNYSALRRLVGAYAATARVRLTAHSLRHAFASHMYARGADLRMIQMLLGHASLSSTSIYAKPSLTHLQLFIEQHHPRGQLYEPRSRYEERFEREM